MRYLIMTVVYILLVIPVGVSAETDPTKEKCYISDFAIMGKNDGTDFLYRMGENLKIKVIGGCVAKIKKVSQPNIVLHLDDVEMTGLNMDRPQITSEGLILSFYLIRDSENDANRNAWNQLLTKQREKGYIMTLPVALAIGTGPALSIPERESGKQFQFYIVDETEASWTILICLAMFFGAYYLLVKNPTVLRDQKNGFYSLGKSQMAFWGLLVALAFAGIWFLTGTMEHIPDQVLILIGISSATGLSAVVIGENKIAANQLKIETDIKSLQAEQKQLETEQNTAGNTFPQGSIDRLKQIKAAIEKLAQQPAAAQSAGFWRDICNNGDGLSFHRLQVVIWTLILGVVFINDVSKVMSMPEFSNTLLMLMGISSGTYLGFKIPEKT
jgi:preprotein translocase subunit YajC